MESHGWKSMNIKRYINVIANEVHDQHQQIWCLQLFFGQNSKQSNHFRSRNFSNPEIKARVFKESIIAAILFGAVYFVLFFHVWTESESKYSTAKSKPEPTIGKVNIRKYFQFLTKKKPFFSEINLSILSHGKNRVLLYSSISPPPVFIVLGKKN